MKVRVKKGKKKLTDAQVVKIALDAVMIIKGDKDGKKIRNLL